MPEVELPHLLVPFPGGLLQFVAILPARATGDVQFVALETAAVRDRLVVHRSQCLLEPRFLRRIAKVQESH